MPYITPDKRWPLLNPPGGIGTFLADVRAQGLSPGELNYVISSLLDCYIGVVKTYDKINEAVGVLECAKLELYRRVAVPYEDEKIAQNGDVY